MNSLRRCTVVVYSCLWYILSTGYKNVFIEGCSEEQFMYVYCGVSEMAISKCFRSQTSCPAFLSITSLNSSVLALPPHCFTNEFTLSAFTYMLCLCGILFPLSYTNVCEYAKQSVFTKFEMYLDSGFERQHLRKVKLLIILPFIIISLSN